MEKKLELKRQKWFGEVPSPNNLQESGPLWIKAAANVKEALMPPSPAA